jgi:putative N6-adenine-specific DNA methylase
MHEDVDDEELVAVTPYGLETTCAEEITRMGGYEIEARTGVVRYTGNLYRSNLMLRTAMRVLRPLREFTITNPKGLYAESRKVNWPAILTPTMTFAVDAHTKSSLLRSGRYVGQVVKDAVADSLRRSKGTRPSVDTSAPHVRIHVSVNDRHVWLALDSSDPPLHKRGYRVQSVAAPMNECLAAALVRMTGFDGTGVFIDPMCGSGTIPIEASLIARNVGPGLLRERFGFFGWRDFDEERWRRERRRAEEAVVAEPDVLVIGADSDRSALSAARRNAEASESAIRLIHAPFDRLRSRLDEESEARIRDAFERRLLLNPPYGRRMSEVDEAELYRSIGDTLKQDFAGFIAWVITASKAGRKSIGLRHSRSLPVYNGGLECRLRRYEMHERNEYGN